MEKVTALNCRHFTDDNAYSRMLLWPSTTANTPPATYISAPALDTDNNTYTKINEYIMETYCS